MNKPLSIVLAAGALGALVSGALADPPAAQPTSPAARSAPSPAAAAGQDTRKSVASADDLPRHTYQIQGKPSEFLLTDKPFKDFLGKLKADTESDLARFKIEDPSALQSHYQVLQQIAMLEGRDAEALAMIEKMRALETKESRRLTTGLVPQAIIAAKKTAGGAGAGGVDQEKFTAAFKQSLSESLARLPWDKARESISQAKARAESATRDLIIGTMQAQLDPVVAQSNGELGDELARGILSARVAIDITLPLNPSIVEVYGKAIDSTSVAKKDVWSDRLIALAPTDKGTPAIVAIWDSGVDIAVFANRLWTNTQEVVNGKDDDANGFIDDIHGIGFDLRGNRTNELLQPLTDLRSEKGLVATHTKGLIDLQSNIESPESVALRQLASTMKPDQEAPLIEDLNMFASFAHGTHVAGTVADGNPFIRIMPVRITFDYRSVPVFAPTMEQAQRIANAITDSVEYMRKAGVRVASLSWGGSRRDIEQQLEKKGAGSTTEDRAEMSKNIFKVQHDALEAALKSAPEILFLVPASNSDNDTQIAEEIPSGLSLPNMLVIGAVDQSGKPTSFTTFGKNTSLYANGFEVESTIPGGLKMKFSGASMASPSAANLAAKILALNPKLTTSEVIDLMTKGADPMDGYPGRFVIHPRKTLSALKK